MICFAFYLVSINCVHFKSLGEENGQQMNIMMFTRKIYFISMNFLIMQSEYSLHQPVKWWRVLTGPNHNYNVQHGNLVASFKGMEMYLHKCWWEKIKASYVITLIVFHDNRKFKLQFLYYNVNEIYFLI